MDQFVTVRVVQANGLNLERFQFDFDLTFSVFLMNADGTVYGRYGSRSDRHDATRDISMEGFGRALEGALELHRAYPANREALLGKQAGRSKFPVPEEFPALRGKYTAKLDYEGKVVQSCIHCHQVRESERIIYRETGAPIPDNILHPWPMPGVLGLHMDPKQRATVLAVDPDSAAHRAGFQALEGPEASPSPDILATVEGQTMLSTADIQWVLQNAPETGELKAVVHRAGVPLPLKLPLQNNWRRNSDISWRVTSWDLRRMATGGLLLRDSTPEERKAAGVSETELSLFVQHVGQYGEHAVAKKAGFLQNDIIVSIGGLTAPMTESGLLSHLLRNRTPGDKVGVRIARNGERMDLILTMQ